ncbi:MAG TPA: FAD-binding oxidoreductase [Bryobacteraceae bacterium]|nr:FAD-binding oxidoreductase [Bryobacteraceae bacterium]HPT26112.1 FAD-binding oxidoreductase [Bryobacteraceae bacterium]
MKATLVETREIAPEVRHFVFEVADAPALNFTPGQWVSITELVKDKKVTRAYSLASAPSGNRFELCLNRVKEGLFSPWLFRLEPGESLTMKGPLGSFTPRQPFSDSVLIATGTGVAPFRSFLQSDSVRQPDSEVTLLLGARYEESLLYRTEFEQLEASRPSFRFLPTLTRPGAGWTGLTGRVQAHLDKVFAGRTDLDVYVCGLRAMVDEVRSLLAARGFEKSRIRFEKYD